MTSVTSLKNISEKPQYRQEVIRLFRKLKLGRKILTDNMKDLHVIAKSHSNINFNRCEIKELLKGIKQKDDDFLMMQTIR